MLGDICNSTYRPLYCVNPFTEVCSVYMCDLWCVVLCILDVHMCMQYWIHVSLVVVCQCCVCVCMHVHKDDWFTRARGAPLRAIQLSGQSLKIGKSMWPRSQTFTNLQAFTNFDIWSSTLRIHSADITQTHAHYCSDEMLYHLCCEVIVFNDLWLLFIWKQHLELKENWLHVSIKKWPWHKLTVITKMTEKWEASTGESYFFALLYSI